MDAENSAHLATEVHFTALDARAKQRAPTYFEDRSGYSKAVGMEQPTDEDTVANFQLKHFEIIRWSNC